MQRRSLLRATAALPLATPPAFVQAPTNAPGHLLTEEFRVEAVDPGIRLYVRNKHPDTGQISPQRTLLFVHGATQPAEATFDLALNGISWMDYIASHNWDVYLMDVRGYGRSTRPPEMDQPADRNPPLVRTDVAVRDVGAVLDFILRRRDIPSLNLIGWSWGCSIMAAYTANNNEKVAGLVLYAPGWLPAQPPSQATRPALGAYVTWNMATARDRLQAGAPQDRKNELMPPGWFEAWSAAVLGSLGSQQKPPVYRSPAGVYQDGRDYWDAGKPLYDPSKIDAATLIVVGEWDRVNPDEGALALFHKLPSRPAKRFVELGEATHLMMVETNRTNLFREVQLFLEEISNKT